MSPRPSRTNALPWLVFGASLAACSGRPTTAPMPRSARDVAPALAAPAGASTMTAASDDDHSAPPGTLTGERARAFVQARLATCADLLATLLPRDDEGAHVTARALSPDAFRLSVMSSGSGRWALYDERVYEVNRGSCSARGMSAAGQFGSPVAGVHYLAYGAGAQTPADPSFLATLSTHELARPDAPEHAAARLVLSSASCAEEPDASSALPDDAVTPALFPAQREHPGTPGGEPATLWTAARLRAAGMPAPTRDDETVAHASQVAAIPTPREVFTQGRYAVYLAASSARRGGGVFAVYDRVTNRHRWVLSLPSRCHDEGQNDLAWLGGAGELAIARTAGHPGRVFAIDLARGTAHFVQRAPSHARHGGDVVASPDALELRGEDGRVLVARVPYDRLLSAVRRAAP